jgi:predicted  nucleic acid-binding Zn-ribbon protein
MTDHMPADNAFTAHLVEAAKMQGEIENLKSGQLDLQTRILGLLGELSGDIKGIRAEMQSVPDKIASCKVEMRREVERDFPDRMDALEMEKRIEKQIEATDRTLSEQITKVENSLNTKLTSVENKLDRQWIKITATITTVAAGAAAIAWVFKNAPFFGG